MPKTKISEFSATPANNTDIDSINIAEGCAPSGINDAIRELMAQLKDWQAGTSNDPMVIGSSGSLTLSQGTANGVTYLNGSKVVTSGTAMVFDGTNLGVGVTPSAWNSSYKAAQIGVSGGASFFGGANFSGMATNYFANSSNQDIYIANNPASSYTQNAGQHIWRTAATGTAGNVITFTQAMTLDASGNLLVGSTSVPSPVSNYKALVVGGTTGGIVDIGTTSTSYGRVSADSVGLNLESLGATTTIFRTNNAERARITSAGDFLIATTSAVGSSRFTVLGAVSRNGIAVQAGDDANYNYIGYNTAGTRTFSVLGNGNVTNTNNSYGAISDAKLKENIVDASPKLVDLMQVKVRNYNMIGNTTKQIGVVAQELETVFPAMVDEMPDRDAENNDLGTTTKSVKYSVFVPMLIKAIQELKTEFDAYKASHP